MAQQRLTDLEACCRHVAGRLGELTYEQKRDALTALGVNVRVYPKDHDSRYTIILSLPLPGSVAYGTASCRDTTTIWSMRDMDSTDVL